MFFLSVKFLCIGGTEGIRFLITRSTFDSPSNKDGSDSSDAPLSFYSRPNTPAATSTSARKPNGSDDSSDAPLTHRLSAAKSIDAVSNHSAESLSKLSVAELKSLLANKGLSSTGNVDFFT